MAEHAVYNEETHQWYRQGTNWDGVTADTYPEAFERLFGHSVSIPPPVRSPRRAHEGD
jgi:hypothetical protein